MHTGTEKVALGLAKAVQVDSVFQTFEATVFAVTSLVEQTLYHTRACCIKQAHCHYGRRRLYRKVAAACQSNSASTEEQLATMEEISASSQALLSWLKIFMLCCHALS
jgi:methyl-accepting chemotaxis protein